MGELPTWYSCLRAARYLGCTPWELAEQPVVWARWALAAEKAEALVRTQAQERAQRRNKKG